MAIDTRQKRASAVSFLTFSRIPGLDNTSLDQAQRQASVWVYSGILAAVAAPALPVTVPMFIPVGRKRRAAFTTYMIHARVASLSFVAPAIFFDNPDTIIGDTITSTISSFPYTFTYRFTSEGIAIHDNPDTIIVRDNF